TTERLSVGTRARRTTTPPSSAPLSGGGGARDSATLTGQTATAGGTVTYAVYTNNTCTALATGLQPVPAAVTVTGGVVPNSAAVTFPSAGTFFWQASYSGDANNNAATSTCTSETLTVTGAGTSIATQLSVSTVAAGGPVAHDSATLSGTTGSPGGTVTYRIYADNTCTTVASVQPSPATVAVTNGTVPSSADVTFSTPGTFFWQAAYSGDASNQPATSLCTSEQLSYVASTPDLSAVVASLSPGGFVVLAPGNYVPESPLDLKVSAT